VENVVHKMERSTEDAAAVKEWLLESFPFLTQHASVVELLSKWDEWYAGILEDEVDPANYDSFSLSPLSELVWRTEWKDVGLFTIAIFSVVDVETDIVIRTTPDPQLYLWKRDDESSPVVCALSLEQVLMGVEQHAQQIGAFLMQITREHQ